jgi:quercetin dioxygenase-like cupin family protein
LVFQASLGVVADKTKSSGPDPDYIGGIVRNWIFVVVLFSWEVASAQEGIVPVDQEPMHKVVLKNDYVEVIRAVLPPGASTLFHRHSHIRATVNLSEATVKEDIPGKGSMQPLVVHAGNVSMQDCAKKPYTHRVSNVGKTVYEVLDIELLKRPDGLRSEPVASPAAENEGFRAYRWELAPEASTPEHVHDRPYLIIAVSKMQLAMTGPSGAIMEHPIKAGDFHWIDQKVTHSLTNKGKESGAIIEVELR